MKVAFYAPLKPPDSPVPSGDRLIGRMLWRAIEAGGHKVVLASRLRSFDRQGNADRQTRIARIGAWTARRVIQRLQSSAERPDIWLTYHLYHKAPDYLGPVVARELGIPYCVAEASSSARQADGAWASGHRATANALRVANLVVSLNPKDEPGIRPLIAAAARIVTLQPFIEGQPFQSARQAHDSHRATWAAKLGLDPSVPWLIAVAMLRSGDKATSYSVLGSALERLRDRPWQLLVVGDGPARNEIEKCYAPLGNRVRFAGQQSSEIVATLMGASDIFTWPAINEAIGMVFIEAAMAGLPMVGADRPGIVAIVQHARTGLLVPEHDSAAFADAVARLLGDANQRSAMGAAAAIHAASHNSVTVAGPLFCRQLEAMIR